MEQQADDLARWHPGVWWTRYSRIRDKHRELIVPQANIFQARCIAAYCWCIANGRAPRLIGLKPRQVGGTTIAAGLSYHHGRRFNSRGISIADTFPKSNNLFRMLRTYIEEDGYDWGFGFGPLTGTSLRLANGTEFEKRSADNPNTSRSDTLQIAHCSETAYWKDADIKSARDVAVSVLNALADHPDTFACSESTPNGAMGLFYEQWQEARWPEFDLYWKQYSTQPDGPGNGWIRVFAAWFEFPEHRESIRRRAPLTPGEEEDIRSTLDAEEKAGMELYGWDLDQVAWRRWCIKNKCLGDPRRFQEEYPTDPETCFLASGSARFDTAGLTALRAYSRAASCQYGLLVDQDGKVTWQRTDENEAMVRIWEDPRVGCKYLISADTMTGESETTKSTDLDAHSILLWRAEYRDQDGVTHHPKLAARIVPPCQLDNKPLAEQIKLLSHYYGRCCVVPETNNGYGLITHLKDADVPIFRMQTYDKAKQKYASTLGWQTNEDRRRDIIDALATRIREQTIDIPCPHVVSELQTFIRNAKGRSEAMSGKHDDDVLSSAIAIFNLGAATEFVETLRQHQLPPDYDAWHGNN